MKVFSAAQVKQWDAYTIAHEPVAAADLMERAATACFNWLQQQYSGKQSYFIFCGKGNNGGDGLALARLLVQQKHTVMVYLLDTGKDGTPEFTTNLKKLGTHTFNVRTLTSEADFPQIPQNSLVIDALFGTGLNKALGSVAAALVGHINASKNPVIAIDIPSGLFADSTSVGNTIIMAQHTLSFQQPKPAFFVAENENCCGGIHVLDIQLSKKFYEEQESVFHLSDAAMARSIYKPRKKFSHKGSYGHACLLAGSYGMMGAAVLSANGCLRSGVGKLTCIIPECGYTIMQTAVPEAMCSVSGREAIETAAGINNFSAVGIGPGMGLHPHHSSLLKAVFQSGKQLVLDADALNTLAAHTELLPLLPPFSILTPHPKEFERLFGTSASDFERLQLALQKSKELNCYIILKGRYSFISSPEGKGYFNASGNAGMATAGSGDVLTGIITGLLAQAYAPLDACILGVYLHGAAGDKAAELLSEEAMKAGDICNFLGAVFKTFTNTTAG